MESMEGEKLGVLDFRIIDHHYSVDIRWKDGKESQHNFPENGFGVYRPNTSKPEKFLKGEEALEILRRYSPTMNEEDFSWLDYVSGESVENAKPQKRAK